MTQAAAINVDELQAGEELDALVAVRIMGWTRNSRGAWVPPPPRPLWVPDSPPHYSTLIAAAWDVVEKITNAFGLLIVVMPGAASVEYTTTEGEFHKFEEKAPTVQLAICKVALRVAALRAVSA